MWLNRKGQAFSIDAVLALIAFAVLLVFILGFWSQAAASSDKAKLRSRLEYAALSSSELLVSSNGVPYDWEKSPSGASSMGLSSDKNILSPAKAANFTAMNYSDAKVLLGMDYDFYFAVEYLNGTGVYSLGNSSIPGAEAVSVGRLALLNGQMVKMRMVVYG